ncbi:SDR family NAD(P)-dependent oxidoreductase [Actinoplanes sp. CA-030573]|uniref:SDR family NAD(P)-dependent oxidoreductase n=1 Tax=Actinoplanes sp. CA-030573 TaxID=3239898 RepID=UPI003D8F6436
MARKIDLLKYGPWAVVTGASDGIGRATAAQLAAAGFSVALVARRVDIMESLAAQLTHRYKVSTTVIGVDLVDRNSVSVIASATSEVDVGLLVQAAGYGRVGSFLDVDAAADNDMITLNIGVVTELAHVFGARLTRRRRGGMILYGSILGWQGGPLHATYSATKAYNQSLAEALHVEWRKDGVDVLAVAPGPVHTGFAGRAGMRLNVGTTPDVVARSTLANLGRRATVVPGGMAKLMTAGLRTAPRTFRAKIMHSMNSSAVDK